MTGNAYEVLKFCGNKAHFIEINGFDHIYIDVKNDQSIELNKTDYIVKILDELIVFSANSFNNIACKGEGV